MKHLYFFIILCNICFISCKTIEEETSPIVTGNILKGEWMLDLGDDGIAIFKFNNGKIYKSIITLKGFLNTYREGIYDIQDNNLVINLNEFTGYDYEYVKMHEWEIIASEDNNTKLIFKELYAQNTLYKISRELELDMTKEPEMSINSLFTNKKVKSIYSYDPAFVEVDTNSIKAVSHGRTIVRIIFEDGSNEFLCIKVKSPGLDAIDYFHKSLGSPPSIAIDIFGNPNAQSDKMWMYEMNDSFVCLFLEEEYDETIVSNIIVEFSDNFSTEMVMQYLEQTYYYKTENQDGTIGFLNKNATFLVIYNKEKHRLYF